MNREVKTQSCPPCSDLTSSSTAGRLRGFLLLLAALLAACGGATTTPRAGENRARPSSQWTDEDLDVFAHIARPGAHEASVDPRHLTVPDVHRLAQQIRLMRTSPHPDFRSERRALSLFVMGDVVHVHICAEAMAALELPTDADVPYGLEYVLQLAASLFESQGSTLSLDDAYFRATAAVVDYYRAALGRGAPPQPSLDALAAMADAGTLRAHSATLSRGCPGLGTVEGLTP